MRILIALLGASSVFAQAAGPSPSLDQPGILRDKLEHKTARENPSMARSFAGQMLKGKRPGESVTVTLALDGKVLEVIENERCAIPLLEMRKKADPAPMPKLKGLSADPMPQARVPAPSCKQMVQAAPGLVQIGPNAYETAP